MDMLPENLMDINTSKKRPWLRSVRTIALAIGIALAAGSYTTPTHAQWIVADPTQIANAIVEYGKDLDRWMATAEQYTKTINFWQEQLVKIESMQFSLFQMQQQFPKLPDDYGVAESCPGASMFSGDITTALANFASSQLSDGDVTTQQRDVCVLLQMTKNQKYEATRLYLKQIDDQATSLQRLALMRVTQIAQSPGKLSSYSADTGKYTADMMQAREAWQTNEQQLDAQVSMLERRQQVLSRKAINGTANDIIGNLVNMAALKTAFSL
jgi:flagellar basal body rod protein FlgC